MKHELSSRDLPPFHSRKPPGGHVFLARKQKTSSPLRLSLLDPLSFPPLAASPPPISASLRASPPLISASCSTASPACPPSSSLPRALALPPLSNPPPLFLRRRYQGPAQPPLRQADTTSSPSVASSSPSRCPSPLRPNAMPRLSHLEPPFESRRSPAGQGVEILQNPLSHAAPQATRATKPYNLAAVLPTIEGRDCRAFT